MSDDGHVKGRQSGWPGSEYVLPGIYTRCRGRRTPTQISVPVMKIMQSHPLQVHPKVHKVSGSCDHSKRNPVMCNEKERLSQVRMPLCQLSRTSWAIVGDKTPRPGTGVRAPCSMAWIAGVLHHGGRACRPVTADWGAEERTTPWHAVHLGSLRPGVTCEGTLRAYEPVKSGTLHLI